VTAALLGLVEALQAAGARFDLPGDGRVLVVFSHVIDTPTRQAVRRVLRGRRADLLAALDRASNDGTDPRPHEVVQ
jgi:hypothetical protein